MFPYGQRKEFFGVTIDLEPPRSTEEILVAAGQLATERTAEARPGWRLPMDTPASGNGFSMRLLSRNGADSLEITPLDGRFAPDAVYDSVRVANCFTPGSVELGKMPVGYTEANVAAAAERLGTLLNG